MTNVLEKIALSFFITLYIIYIMLKIRHWTAELFEKTPVGECKEWIWTLPTGYGLAINFTNIDNKHGTWHFGFFRIKKH